MVSCEANENNESFQAETRAFSLCKLPGFDRKQTSLSKGAHLRWPVQLKRTTMRPQAQHIHEIPAHRRSPRTKRSESRRPPQPSTRQTGRSIAKHIRAKETARCACRGRNSPQCKHLNCSKAIPEEKQKKTVFTQPQNTRWKHFEKALRLHSTPLVRYLKANFEIRKLEDDKRA